jgi:GntR family transcriptional regulator
MQIKIDFRSSQPIYVQITEQIRQMVASGELKEGDQLPTVRQLATDLRVNFNTVARAYRLLDEAGLISTQQGRGTYIWETPSHEGMVHLRQHSLDSLTRRYLSEVGRLDYTPDEVIESFEQNIKSWRESGEPPETHPEYQ